MGLRYALLAATLAFAPIAAEAQQSFTYRCTGTDKKKYYGSTIPPQCAGQIVEQLSTDGRVIKRFDPEGEEKLRKEKEANAAKKREEEALAKEVSRRNGALLATYSSEKDIDDARGRALADNEKAVKEVEQRIDAIKKRQAGYEKEMEFYQEGAPRSAADKKGKAPMAKGAKPPPKLMDDIKAAEMDLATQEGLLASKKKEVEAVNAKYDQDKRRYGELTKRK
jgi:hypothetical protein